MRDCHQPYWQKDAPNPSLKVGLKRLVLGLVFAGMAAQVWAQGSKSIAVGDHHVLALKAGKVWAWGANTDGQLGVDPQTLVYDLVPREVNSLPSDIVALAAGGAHSLALDSAGVVWAWGRNQEGQLGDGTTTDHVTAVRVNDLLPADVNVTMTAICAGESFSLALDNAGDIWAWGDNSHRQLGFKSVESTVTTPTRITQINDKVLSITAGLEHSLAVVGTELYGWGSNSNQQVKIIPYFYDLYPQLIVLSPIQVQAAAAGGYHSLSLDKSGLVWGWGNNLYGQLGNGTFASPNEPAMAEIDPNVEIVEVLAGTWHSLAVDANQGIWTWGDDLVGQLGQGHAGEPNALPIRVDLADVNQVAVGSTYNLALDTSGIAWGWGQLALDINGVGDVNQFSPTMIDGFPCLQEITAGVGGSITTPQQGSHLYGLGQTVMITAEPNDFYTFSFWSGSAVDQNQVGDPNQAVTTLTIQGDRTLQANFTPIPYTLTIQSTDGGQVTVPGEGTFTDQTHDAPVQITAQRNNDAYSFVTWTLISGTGSFADANATTTTFTLSSDCVIEAQFEPVTLVDFTDSALKGAVIETLNSVYDISVTDTPNNKDMEKLLSLDASERGIADLNGLEAAVNLETLNLNDNQVSDLNPLVGLTQLKTLLLCRNNGPDLETLVTMNQLITLHLSGNAIPDYEILTSLQNLEYLVLNETNQTIEDLPDSWLTAFPKLKVLSIRGNQGLRKSDVNIRLIRQTVCQPNGGDVAVD